MSFQVELTAQAEEDLVELVEYIALHDSFQQADYVYEQVAKVVSRLTAFPDRGSYPPELLALGLREFRQVFFKPYRIVYRVMEKKVTILLIADGRRDLGSLLAQRLL